MSEEDREIVEQPQEVLRAPDGKWLPGTPSPNPKGQPRKEQRYIDLLHQTVTDEDVIAIIKEAVRQAKEGNRWARTFLWNYGVGKPRQMLSRISREAPILTLFKLWAGIKDGDEVRTLAAEVVGTLPDEDG